MGEQALYILITFLLTFSSTSFTLLYGFQKRFTKLKEEIDAAHDIKIVKCQKDRDKTLALTYAPLTSMNDIKLVIIEIQSDIKGLVKTIERVEKVLSKSSRCTS